MCGSFIFVTPKLFFSRPRAGPTGEFKSTPGSPAEAPRKRGYSRGAVSGRATGATGTGAWQGGDQSVDKIC